MYEEGLLYTCILESEVSIYQRRGIYHFTTKRFIMVTYTHMQGIEVLHRTGPTLSD